MKEISLIKEYMNNDKLDIEKVMDCFTPYIYTILNNKNSSLNNEDIEEIISDVFLAVWKNQEKLDLNKPMSAYLGGIANNLFTKKVRNLTNNVDIDDYENLYANENVENKTESEEKNKIIISEINKMKEEDKIIFISYYYYSKTMREIANEIDISEEKVKSRLFRIRKKLKKCLERRGYSYSG